MSVHPYKTADGTRWQVRWRETPGNVRTRSFTSKRDALAHDADVKRRKYSGDALPRPAKETLGATYEEYVRLAGPTLAPATLRTYQAMWDAHVRGRFDHHRLTDLVNDPQLFAEFMAEMRGQGVGNPAQRKTLVVISAVLSEAVRWNKIATNPLWGQRKPPATRRRYPHPFPPVVIERIRLAMRIRVTKRPAEHRGKADSCLVGLMSYAGLRPAEALALCWGDIGERTITVDKAVRDGAEASTKTMNLRVPPLAATLREDLLNLRQDVGSPDDTRLIFPSRSGGHWSRSEQNNWRNRVWGPIVHDLATGEHPLPQVANARPYDCRATFVSLHLRARKSPVQVALWAGHSQAVMFQHYAHVIEELDAEPDLPVDAQILRAREVIAGLNQLQLDLFTAELMEHPTVAVAGDRSAAAVVYAATGLELWGQSARGPGVGFAGRVGPDPSASYLDEVPPV